MRTRETHSPFFPTVRRYAGALCKDESFQLSAKMLGGFLLASAAVFLALGLLGWWAEVYRPQGEPAPPTSTQTWKEFLFGLLGSIDAMPEAGAGSVLYSAFVRLVGAVVIGGVITSFLCALVERFAEMKLRGLLVPVMRDHFVVVGCGAMTDDLVRGLLDPKSPREDPARWTPQERADSASWKREVRKRRVLLCTGEDVEKTRETIEAVLPREIARRIVYAFGDMNLGPGQNEVCGRLCLEDARQIYVLGDEAASSAGDVENLAFARGVGRYLASHGPKHPDGLPKPVFVRLDGGTSFDFVKKISFETDPIGKGEDRRTRPVGSVTSYFKPFSFTEGWARRIWGEATAGGPDAGNCDAGELDFAPMGPDSFVHLVVAGLTPMGEALVLEAVRVCHYPNGRPTRITVVDPDPAAEDRFLSRHPWFRDVLPDVRIDFLPVRIESGRGRELLRASATDRDALLTVAICFRRSDAALSAALNLPEEVFWHRLPAVRRTVRDSYRENGARIRVFQEHRHGLSELSGNHPRYERLGAFGMQEGGFTAWCVREFCAMYLNAVYDWPNDVGGSWLDGCSLPFVEAFRAKWAKELAPGDPNGVFRIDATEKKNLLLEILCAGPDGKEIRRFQKYAFEKYVARLEPELRWANVYVSDSYGTMFRALGLRAVRDEDEDEDESSAQRAFAQRARENDKLFSEARARVRPQRSLAETEHARWVADRALMGYRAARVRTGEVRDDAFRYHNDLIPFDRLSAAERGKDELSIACIPLFMALEGIRLVKEERGEA